MRISTNHQFDSYSRDIARTSERYFELQGMVASGKRLNKPSDDPAGMASYLTLQSFRSANAQYQQNLSTAKGYLSVSESSLGDANEIMKRAYQLAVSGANSTTAQESRNAMANEITDLQKRLLDTANTQEPSGQYVFAGQKTDTKPFTVVGGVAQYNGDANAVNVENAPGEVMAATTNISTDVLAAYNRLEQLKNDLQGGNVGNLSGVDIPAMQGSMDSFTQTRGSIGARLQNVERQTADYTKRLDDIDSRISDVEDVDIAGAVLQLKQAETAYQGALTVASQGFRLSLMDFIKG